MAHLDRYHEKRDFSKTKEPRGRERKAAGDIFVVQKHSARRLHYDFRLALDGVLKSWAVARGPSLVPDEKRLAIRVEDHPYDYANFEGVIPEGQYGAGPVIVWDRGRWIPEGDPREAYKKGRMTFTLRGEKLKGKWHLVRMHRRGAERRDLWLLMKAADAAARSRRAKDILRQKPRSVLSRRSIEDVAAGGRAVLKRRETP